MNWYKSLLKSSQSVLNKPVYLEVGHTSHKSSYDEEFPNYLWVYVEGEIRIEPEKLEEHKGTPYSQNHYKAFPELHKLFDRFYYGRYESATGRLSLAKPIEGIAAVRDVPNILISKLYREFPNTKEIFTY